MIGISKEFCGDDAMPDSCLSLFTNLRSKSEGRLLGQGLWSNSLCHLHINYAIAVLFFPLDSLYSFFKKWGESSVGWNVRGVKCLRGEMCLGWNVPGWNILGWNVFGVKCVWVEMYRGEISWGEMSSRWIVLTPDFWWQFFHLQNRLLWLVLKNGGFAS